jgi:hypothetical protein
MPIRIGATTVFDRARCFFSEGVVQELNSTIELTKKLQAQREVNRVAIN